MFKKVSLLFSLLLPISLFSGEIVEYNSAEYKDAITKIAFQDTDKLFLGSIFFKKLGCFCAGSSLFSGLIGYQISNNVGRNALYAGAAGWALVSGLSLLESRFDCLKINKNTLEAMLNDSKKNKDILIVNKEVAGFITTFMDTEESIEGLKEKWAASGQPLTATDEQYKKLLPGYKMKKSECGKFFKIEWLAVDKAHRRKGHGKQLINNSLKRAQEENVSYAEIDVVSNNSNAQRLYEKLGFVVTEPQPLGSGLWGITQLRKSLKDQV